MDGCLSKCEYLNKLDTTSWYGTNHWENYGKQMGFGVRKGFLSKSKLYGKVTTRFTYCKEGVRRLNKQNHLYTCHQDEIRTNCLVRLYVSLVRETGKYKVYDFVAEHNHILHLKETTYMMRLHHKMSKVQAFEIDLACASRISHKATHASMSIKVGGQILDILSLIKKKLSSNTTTNKLDIW